jgi:hypothetical protein
MLRLLDPKTHRLCPYEYLGGGTASLSPFRRSPHSAYGSLPPLLGQDLNSALRPRGHTPLEPPLICAHWAGRKSVKACSVSGSALLTSSVRNQARSAFKRFFPSKSLRKIEVLISLGQKWRVFGIQCPECLLRALEMFYSDEFVFFVRKWD